MVCRSSWPRSCYQLLWMLGTTHLYITQARCTAWRHAASPQRRKHSIFNMYSHVIDDVVDQYPDIIYVWVSYTSPLAQDLSTAAYISWRRVPTSSRLGENFTGLGCLSCIEISISTVVPGPWPGMLCSMSWYVLTRVWMYECGCMWLRYC